METWILFLIYIGYISISCFVAYPLLKWKKQEPKSWQQVFGVFIVNCFLFGLMPLLPFFMRFPSENKDSMSISESEDYYQYHSKGKIWFWQK